MRWMRLRIAYWALLGAGKSVVLVMLLFLLAKPAAGLDYSNTIAVSSSFITNLMAQHSIPGVTIVLVESQRVVWAQGFGYADKELQTPVTTNTVMMIGSVSKLLTTLMALQIVDEGAFDLDACITNYVPDFAMLPRYAGQTNGWTLRTMLDHHSGLPGDIYNGAFVVGPYWSDYTRWLIKLFHDDYLLYPPNLLASYCNSGFNIVGEAIGLHDNVDYTVSAENRVFALLDMPYSSFLLDKATVTDNLATGYGEDGTPSPVLLANMPATGGAFSRPLDMANIIKMLLAEGRCGTNRFLSTNALAELGTFTPGPMDVDSFFITGLGLDTVSDPVLNYAGRTWLKNGSTGKFESLFEVLPDQQLGAFVNINCANSMTFAILRAVLTNAVIEKSGLVPPAPVPMSTPAVSNCPFAALQGIEGYYVTKSGVDRFIAETNGSLSCVHGAQTNSALTTNYLLHANGRFFVPAQPAVQLAFTNLAGRDVIVRYGSDGSVKDEVMYGGYAEYLYGTRYAPPPISAAWSNRCNTFWMADNLMFSDFLLYEGVPSGWLLALENGVLTIEGNGSAALAPVNDDLAFVAGLSSRGDSCVRIETNAIGQEKLCFGGYHCTRSEDLPIITNRGVMTASLSMHTNALLLYSNCVPGNHVAIILGTNASNAVVSIFSMEQAIMIARGTGSVQWVCDSESAVVNISSSNTVECQVRAVRYLAEVNDYDGNAASDCAVFDKDTGYWYIAALSEISNLKSQIQAPRVIAWAFPWGGPGLAPVSGDYDGDGISDCAMFDQNTGYWYIAALSEISNLKSHIQAPRVIAWTFPWGGPGLVPVSGDYDGDGVSDLAVFDNNTGAWYVRTVAGAVPVWGIAWGWPGAVPVSGDYDGDGISDLAVFDRNTGAWYVRTVAGAIINWGTPWGWPGAIPVGSALTIP